VLQATPAESRPFADNQSGRKPTVNHDMDSCIQACLDCHRVCLATVAHCLQQGGSHAEAAHIRIMLDCAQICLVSADFMIRGSTLHGRICAVCAETCRACEQSCSGHPDADDAMRRCAEACRRCAEECERMAR
jgi:hypothetical protein